MQMNRILSPLVSSRPWQTFVYANYRKQRSVLVDCSPSNILIRNYSTLYISRYKEDVTGVVNVDLPFDELLHQSTGIENSLQKRKLKFDVQRMKVCYDNLQQLRVAKNALEARKTAITKEIELTRTEKQKKELIEKVRAIKSELKPLLKHYYRVEEELMLAALKLPNTVPANAPTEDRVLLQTESRANLTQHAKHHDQFGQANNLLLFSEGSEGGCYLLGDAALLEYDLSQHFSASLKLQGFSQLAPPDMMKTLVLEACGKDFKNSEEVLILQPRHGELEDLVGFKSLDKYDINDVKLDRLFYLCGASLEAFAAFLTRMNLTKSSLPWNAHTVGRSYQPTSAKLKTGLLNLNQATVVHSVGVGDSRSQCDELFTAHKDLLWRLYQPLNFLPLRLVEVGASRLSFVESARCDLEAWLPAHQAYVPIASVCRLDDFVSRRLMVRVSPDADSSGGDTPVHSQYAHMVFSNVLNFPRLLAVLLENCQNGSGQWVIPEQLLTTLRSVNNNSLLALHSQRKL